MRYRYISPTRRWLMLQNEMAWMLERDKSPGYLEPWERIPVDPAAEHIVVVEHEAVETPWRQRVTCACGLDRGWQAPIVASQDAGSHREKVRQAKSEHGLDSLPVPLIERQQTAAGVQFRRICECGDNGAWLLSEPVAALSSMLHFQACEERRKERDAAYEQRMRDRARRQRRR